MAQLLAKYVLKDANTLQDDGSGNLQVNLHSGQGLTSTASGIAIASGEVTNDMLAGSIASAKLADEANIAFLNQAETVAAVWDFGSFLPTVGADPTTDNQIVRKSYVDSLAAGLDPKASCRVASTTYLDNATGNVWTKSGSGVGKTLTAGANGATTLDGVVLAQDNRVLIKDEADTAAGTNLDQTDNGIYVVTQAGDGSNPTILTRATDQDGSPANEVSGGNFTFIEQGTVLNGSGWVVIHDGNLTVDTDDVVWTQFTSAAAGSDVSAAANLTDNALVRGDGGSKGIQDSGWLLGDTNILTAAGNLIMGANDVSLEDNSTIVLGTGLDATILYNGTNLVINPKAAGSGKAVISGTLHVDDNDALELGTGNDATIVYDGSDLVINPDAGAGGASSLKVNGQVVTPQVVLTNGATINTDCNNGNSFDLTIDGTSGTLANPTNLEDGAMYTWLVRQAAGGSHTLLFGSKFAWPNGTAPTLSDTAGDVDVISGVYDAGDDLIYVDVRTNNPLTFADLADSTHASSHIQGGADEIDGDLIDVDATPVNYTPVTTAGAGQTNPATDVDHLAAHLIGIDNALATAAVSTKVVETFTYTGALLTNNVVGPLSSTPDPVASDEAELIPVGGIDQEYGVDYTVAELTAVGTTGLALGHYYIVGTTLPTTGGATWSGSAPSTGITSLLADGDKLKARYSS